MDITPLIPKGLQRVEAYGSGGFTVSSQHYDGSVMVFADHTQLWPVADWAMVQAGDFEAVLQASPLPEMVIIGCGKNFEMLPKTIKQFFRHHGIAVEAMDTGAACRTYNILLSEGRRVAAALIAV